MRKGKIKILVTFFRPDDPFDGLLAIQILICFFLKKKREETPGK